MLRLDVTERGSEGRQARSQFSKTYQACCLAAVRSCKGHISFSSRRRTSDPEFGKAFFRLPIPWPLLASPILGLPLFG